MTLLVQTSHGILLDQFRALDRASSACCIFFPGCRVASEITSAYSDPALIDINGSISFSCIRQQLAFVSLIRNAPTLVTETVVFLLSFSLTEH